VIVCNVEVEFVLLIAVHRLAIWVECCALVTLCYALLYLQLFNVLYKRVMFL
jgi:hypothetical protein